MSDRFSVDFGTSSIRIARYTKNTEYEVVDLGRWQEPPSSIDEASVRSAIFISENGRTVYWGEEAFSRLSRSLPSSLEELSPKLWLSDLSSLNLPISTRLPITRKDLITGLLSYALSLLAKRYGLKEVLGADFSLASPIWAPAIRESVDNELIEIWRNAISRISDKPTSSQMVEELKPGAGRSINLYKKSLLSVQEPIASGLALIQPESNTRRIFVVIDVGAGTTDIAFFTSVTRHADEVLSRVRSVAKPVSLMKAGDYIDKCLIDLVLKKKFAWTASEKRELKTRIREIKEVLFAAKRVNEFDISIKLSEFLALEEIVHFASEVRREVEHGLAVTTSLSIGRGNSVLTMPFDPSIYLIFAGGGARLPFLQEALARPFEFDSARFYAKNINSDRFSDINFQGASLERLAVSLGGVDPEYKQLMVSHADTVPADPKIGNPLGHPLHQVSNTVPSYNQKAVSSSDLSQAPENKLKEVPPGQVSSESQQTKKIVADSLASPKKQDINQLLREAEGSLKHSVEGGNLVYALTYAKFLLIQDSVKAKMAAGILNGLAESGDIEACKLLGDYYLLGLGFGPNFAEALYWYFKAEERQAGASAGRDEAAASMLKYGDIERVEQRLERRDSLRKYKALVRSTPARTNEQPTGRPVFRDSLNQRKGKAGTPESLSGLSIQEQVARLKKRYGKG